jgi:hypothetical protein
MKARKFRDAQKAFELKQDEGKPSTFAGRGVNLKLLTPGRRDRRNPPKVTGQP